jgi:ribokinase
MLGYHMHDTTSLFVLGSFVVACSAKVARLPQPGESLRADAFTVEAGGKGLNLALGAHRLGAKVDGLLAIGNDFLAQLADSALAHAGLSPAMLRRYEGATGSGIGFTDVAGETCLAVYPGANLLLAAEDVRSAAAAVRRASLVLAQFEIGDEPILEAFTLAREGNSRTLLNPSPSRKIDTRILERTSIVVMNRVEALWLERALGLSPVKCSEQDFRSRFGGLADALLDRGPDTVIITLGRDGALAYRHGTDPLYQPAFPVQARDTLGAGDAFTAGLAVSLLEGRCFAEGLTRAAACGAITTQKLGVFDALPFRDELAKFLPTSR